MQKWDSKRDTDVFWTLWERARVGWYGRMALKHVNYHMWNESSVQAQCMRQDAQGWCTGMTQRDGMGRVGGGFRMGNTCTPMEDSSQCMAKPIQHCNVKYINKFFFKKWREGRDPLSPAPTVTSPEGIVAANENLCWQSSHKVLSCPKIPLFSLPVYPCSPLTPWDHWSFAVSMGSAFSRTS